MKFILVTLCIVPVLLLVWLLFLLADSNLGGGKYMKGVLVGREYYPAQVQPTVVGKVVTIITIPDSYSVDVDIKEINRTLKCPASEKLYENYFKGLEARFLVSPGALTNKYYCKEI